MVRARIGEAGLESLRIRRMLVKLVERASEGAVVERFRADAMEIPKIVI